MYQQEVDKIFYSSEFKLFIKPTISVINTTICSYCFIENIDIDEITKRRICNGTSDLGSCYYYGENKDSIIFKKINITLFLNEYLHRI